jgi:hypothetical protein|tara:strand:+ start:700 stop:927 length:228 start_codon:yes stop_codon:yes gene_type:complete
MDCEYCKKIFGNDEDSILNYLQHIQINHNDELSDEEKITHNIREKMIQSKKIYKIFKERTGDSDLVFNSKNSDDL